VTIKTTKLKDGGYVVAENDVWVEGVYATEAAARKGAKANPDTLAKVWQQVLSADRDNGMITEDML
jgi:hypothetical protein